MSNYTKTTDFDVKDSLPSGDTGKIIRGSEFEVEFENIEVAIASKADSLNTVLTGNTSVTNLSVTGNTTLGNAASDTVTVNADFSSDLLPSADATYDLGAPGSEWQDLYVTGTANVDSLVADTVAISGGTVTATLTGNVTGNLTGTVLTAAQPNITSVGTLTSASISGDLAVDTDTLFVDVSADRVGINTSSPAYPLHVNGASALFGIGSVDDPDTEVRIRKRFDGTAKLSFDVSNVGSPVPCYISSDGNENLTFAYNDAVVTTAYLNIMSNGSEVARMTAAGSFGIGTSSPAEKLHVAGNAVIRNATDTSIYIRAGNTTGVAGIQFGDSDAAFRGKIEYDNSTETLSLASNGYTPADLVIASNGNVGIGTASPAAKLEVQNNGAGAADVARFLRANGAAISFLDITPNPDDEEIILDFSGSVAQDAIFRSGGVERMRIKAGGNVGIGVTSPTAKLHVAGTIQSQSGSSVAQMYSDGSAAYFTSVGAFPSIFSTNGIERLRIDSSGNVGIGTTSPNDPLHVIGQTRIENSGNAARLVIARNDNANSADSASLDLLENASANQSFGAASAFGFRLEVDGSTNKLNIVSGNGATTADRFTIGRDTGDISFYEDTGTTPKLFWDASAEALGIGTTSPAAKLEIGGAGEGIILASPNGTKYKITVANDGTLTTTAV